jgi:hypothetical protein
MPVSTSIDADSLLGASRAISLLIRLAATVGFAIAPCALGFVIIGVSEQLISWIADLSMGEELKAHTL